MGVDWPAGSTAYTVTAEAVERYISACGGSWPGRDGVVPLTLASVYCYGAVAAMPVRAGVVLTGQKYEFLRRLSIGERVVTDFEVSEEYERKGRTYMVIQTRTRDEAGELVCVGEITRMLPAESRED